MNTDKIQQLTMVVFVIGWEGCRVGVPNFWDGNPGFAEARADEKQKERPDVIQSAHEKAETNN